MRIQPVAPLPASAEATAETSAQGTNHESDPSVVAEQSYTMPAIANPSLRLDPALGLVVLEFHSGTGAVTNSIPSERQIEAYQRWTQTGIGAPPGNLVSGAATDGRQAAQPPPAQQADATPQPPRPSPDEGDQASSQDP